MILVNSGHIPEDIQQRYAEEQSEPVKEDLDKLTELGLTVIRDHIVSYEDRVIRHDTKKVAALLVSLLET
jgi:hypothetical protein